MNALEKAVAYAVDLAILGVLLGLIVRRRWSACLTFTLQMAVILVSDLLILLWPLSFFTRTFWLQKESLAHFLTLAIALELTFKTFQAFPGARATARGVLLVVVGVALVAALSVSPGKIATVTGDDGEWLTLVYRLYPRLMNGAIWLFTAIAALILWFRLPVDVFQKAILVGFVPYMLIYTLVLGVLPESGSRLQDLLKYSHPLAYLAATLYWARAAWQPFRLTVRPSGRVQAPATALPRS